MIVSVISLGKARNLPRFESAESETTAARGAAPLAPRWHTALLVFVLVSSAVTGVWGVSGARAPLSAKSRILDLYLPTIAASLLMTAYVCRVGRRANALTSLIGRGFTSVLGALADLGWAALLAASILGFERAWIGAFGARQTASFGALMPHSVAEGAVWIVVAMTVGFCEEVVYRGYLRIQFTAFTRSSVVGNALQAALS